MELPQAVARFLGEYHAGGVTGRDCCACSSPCCSLGGFAILENVVQIYARYRRGTLRRTDYDFEPGLGFGEFAFKYFDVYKKTVVFNGADATLMLFHMKSLSADGHVISIPGGDDYWDVRNELFELNPWLNRGCVFLSRQVDNWPSDDADAGRHCMLHAPGSATAVTAKPIDCVFFTCNRPREARVPTDDQSTTWFRLLAQHFPNSLERFEALIAEKNLKEPGSLSAELVLTQRETGTSLCSREPGRRRLQATQRIDVAPRNFPDSLHSIAVNWVTVKGVGSVAEPEEPGPPSWPV